MSPVVQSWKTRILLLAWGLLWAPATWAQTSPAIFPEINPRSSSAPVPAAGVNPLGDPLPPLESPVQLAQPGQEVGRPDPSATGDFELPNPDRWKCLGLLGG